jgi:MoxR-like ATPase
MADALDLKFSRIQFTPDMQPADITAPTFSKIRKTDTRSCAVSSRTRLR